MDTRRILLSLSRAWKPFSWSIFGHINASLMVFILGTGLELHVTILDCIVLVPPILLILTIPISIGGWGVRESVMISGFALVGVTNEAALVLSVLFGLTTLLVSLPGGIVWLLTRGKPGDQIDMKIGIAGMR